MGSLNGEEATIVDEFKGPHLGLGTGLLDLALEYSKDDPAPEIFRKWAALCSIGAAAERRVWTQFQNHRLYPNMFIFLVGPPGTGKTVALSPMEELLRKSQAVGLAPNDCTKQGLLDALGDAGKGAILDGKPFDYHFLHVSIAELSNFMSKYDLELAGILTDLWDCRSFNDEKKRSGAGKLIPYPGVSLLVGTATENLGNTIPNEMWGSGFMARVIMVYSAEEIIPHDMFTSNPRAEELATKIALGFRKIGALKGPMLWLPEAQTLLRAFRINSKHDAPLHNRLEHYGIRRWMHLAKVCMVSALADQRMVITADDFNRSLSWLTHAEGHMAEVFKGMNTHEDGAIYEEMRSQMFAVYLKGAKNPIPASVLYAFLSTRVGSHSVERMIEISVASGMFNRVAGTSGIDAQYVPQPPRGGMPSGVI